MTSCIICKESRCYKDERVELSSEAVDTPSETDASFLKGKGGCSKRIPKEFYELLLRRSSRIAEYNHAAPTSVWLVYYIMEGSTKDGSIAQLSSAGKMH